MKIKVYIFLGFGALLFLLPVLTLAAEKKIIFSPEFLTSQLYLNSANQWQIFNNIDEGLYPAEEGLLLKSDGDAYLVYPFQFSSKDYDRLRIKFFSDQSLAVTILPNVFTTAYHTFELNKKVSATSAAQEINFSLKLPFFSEPLDNLSINFKSQPPANIVIEEISLEKMDSAQLMLQAIKDYFRVAPYSPFSVNLFPAPRIFGRSALVYFLPIILVLVWLFLFAGRFRKIAAIILFGFWLLTDLRMSYEFFSYHFTDYQSYVKPPAAEKSLRNYEDFYQFSDWLKNNLSSADSAVNFYNFGSVHFPRLLQYLIYPVRVISEQPAGDIYVIYNRTDIVYNPADRKLHNLSGELSKAGEIVASYNQNSFIFKEQ